MLSLRSSFILLFCIFLTIFVFAKLLTVYQVKNTNKKQNETSSKKLIKNFIGLTLIVFGLLKLYDLEKFVNIFSKYDLISKKINIYGYSYPFIEILLGILTVSSINVINNIKIIIILMTISIISVGFSLFKGQQLRCGCLGAFFHVPLSYITLSENIMMIIMGFKYLL